MVGRGFFCLSAVARQVGDRGAGFTGNGLTGGLGRRSTGGRQGDFAFPLEALAAGGQTDEWQGILADETKYHCDRLHR